MKVKNFKWRHFEGRHFVILFLAIVGFQVILTVIHNTSTRSLLLKTMEIYRKDFVERVADLTTTSLELLLEQAYSNMPNTEEEERRIIQKFNIILSQQLLQRNVKEMCLVLERNNRLYFLNDGRSLYRFFFKSDSTVQSEEEVILPALRMYYEIRDELKNNEVIISYLDEKNGVKAGVPLVPWGEFYGMVYMRVVPDLRNIEKLISSSYNETGAIFTAIILFGLLGMFFVSSYTFKERDIALSQLYEERANKLKAEIEHRKEQLFTKRIYHAHHKAEKIMGFINKDLNIINKNNIEEVKNRVLKYTKFISRVIYNMKTFEPPIHIIRGSMFHTDVNEVIKFLVKNVFLRTHKMSSRYDFKMELDKEFPILNINEFVIWEILEPLIQNKIDHNGGKNVVIRIKTTIYKEKNIGEIIIEDNGANFPSELVLKDEDGIQLIFKENVTTKKNVGHSGYGCYIAYENCKKCGWDIVAENKDRWARYRIIIPITGGGAYYGA